MKKGRLCGIRFASHSGGYTDVNIGDALMTKITVPDLNGPRQTWTKPYIVSNIYKGHAEVLIEDSEGKFHNLSEEEVTRAEVSLQTFGMIDQYHKFLKKQADLIIEKEVVALHWATMRKFHHELRRAPKWIFMIIYDQSHRTLLKQMKQNVIEQYTVKS